MLSKNMNITNITTIANTPRVKTSWTQRVGTRTLRTWKPSQKHQEYDDHVQEHEEHDDHHKSNKNINIKKMMTIVGALGVKTSKTQWPPLKQ
jgi:hypothetical protein